MTPRGRSIDAVAQGQLGGNGRVTTVQDCAFLVTVLLLSALLYVSRIGFYSDDWSSLALMAAAPDQSLPGLFEAMNVDHVRIRPVQALYQAALYRAFGMNPSGYHVVNTLVLTATVVLFYLALREAGLRRTVAVSVPLVFGLLPNYCTDRFWYAAFQITLSMFLVFVSLYATLRSLRARRHWAAVALCALSAACAALSALTYEVQVPLFLAKWGAAWVVQRLWKRGQTDAGAAGLGRVPALATLIVPDVLALAAAFAYKVSVNVRIETPISLGERFWYVLWVGRQAIEQHFGRLGIEYPRVVWRAARYYATPSVLLLGIAVSILIALYLSGLYRAEEEQRYGGPPQKPVTPLYTAGLAAAGLVVFGLGYAVFAVARQIIFTPFGIANRIAIASSAGLAFLVVGAALLPGTLSRSRPMIGRIVFPVLTAAVCFGGFVVINAVAAFWIESGMRARAVLSQIAKDVPALPPGSTLLLDGICPYVGPAIVFESDWDLKGALLIRRRDTTLIADVVHPSTTCGPAGVSNVMYLTRKTYPYSSLYVYDYSSGKLLRLTDYPAARRYFATQSHNCGGSCPRSGEAGIGVRVF